MPARRLFTLEGRITLLVAANVVVAVALTLLSDRIVRVLGISGAVGLIAAAALSGTVAMFSTRLFSHRITRTLSALADGVRGLRDRDFSLRLAALGDDEITDLVRLYNEVGDLLRAQRNDIYQKELLLDTILQESPMAVLLVNPASRVVFSNLAARELLGGVRLDGRHFDEVVEALVSPLREAIRGGTDALITVTTAAEQEETFRLVRRDFHVNTQRHSLVMVERLTPELRRQEVGVWKKAIRIMSHELNNSIAPIRSLMHSARHVQDHPEHANRLGEIYETIEERLDYLRAFLEGYARFARLPEPDKSRVPWAPLLDDARRLYPFTLVGEAPREGCFDRTQIEQVLINLLKNAHESGSPADQIAVAVTVAPPGDGTLVRVMDRGAGMEEAVLRRALLPFYSTKPTGTGLGLALCNEIIEAHHGRLTLQRREGGGLTVSVWLP